MQQQISPTAKPGTITTTKLPTGAKPQAQQVPKLSGAREFLLNKWVTIYSASKTFVTEVYNPTEGEGFGIFDCQILDIHFDKETFLPVTALVRYREKGRRHYYIDLIPMAGVSISVKEESDENEDDEDTDA